MNIEKLLEDISRIEHTIPVNGYSYKGTLIWPVIRYRLLLKFKNSFSKKEQKPKAPASTVKRSLPSELYLLLKSKLKANKEFQNAGLRQHDVLLFGRLSDHSDKIEGRKYNRLIDPFVDYFRSKNIPTLKLEIGRPGADDRFNSPLMFDDSHFGTYYRSRQRLSGKKDRPENEVKYLLEKVKNETGVAIDTNDVFHNLDRIFYFKELFLKLLKKIDPRVVFLSGYYSADTFGLLSACKSLGIVTVDIQHGKQGKFHPMYSHWTSVPEGGYELLPTYFWNWGEESVQNIMRWMPSHSPHSGITGGNPWISRWMNNDVEEDKDWSELLQKIEKYKRVVLFSLQPIGNENFPFYLDEVIRQTTNDCLWLIRLHPLMKSEDVSSIDKYKVHPNVETELSTRQPLFRLLKRTSMHITCWSSVAFEAQTFDVPTVIIHSTGETVYREQIENGTFYYASDAEKLRDLVLNGKSNDNSSRYIRHDEQARDMAMSEIFKKANISI